MFTTAFWGMLNDALSKKIPVLCALLILLALSACSDGYVQFPTSPEGQRALGDDVEVIVLSAENIGDFTSPSRQHQATLLPGGRNWTYAVGAGDILSVTGFALTLASITAQPGRRFYVRQVDERRAINDLRDRLSVSERGRASGILEVRLTGENRAEDVRSLDAIIQAYLGQNISRSSAEAESSLTFIRAHPARNPAPDPEPVPRG